MYWQTKNTVLTSEWCLCEKWLHKENIFSYEWVYSVKGKLIEIFKWIMKKDTLLQKGNKDIISNRNNLPTAHKIILFMQNILGNIKVTFIFYRKFSSINYFYNKSFFTKIFSNYIRLVYIMMRLVLMTLWWSAIDKSLFKYLWGLPSILTSSIEAYANAVHSYRDTKTITSNVNIFNPYCW